MDNHTYKAHGWVIIGRNNPPCAYCRRAKALLDACDYTYTFLTLDNHPIFKKFLSEQLLTTVPQVFHRGMRVGGFDELKGYIARLEWKP